MDPANPSLIGRLLEGVGSAGLQLGLRDQRGSKILTQRTYRTGTPKMSSQPSLPCYFAAKGGHGTNSIYFEEASVIFSGLLLTAPDKRQD